MNYQEWQLIHQAQAKIDARRLPSSIKSDTADSSTNLPSLQNIQLAPATTVPQRRRSAPVWADGMIGRQAWLMDQGEFLGDFYSYIRRRVPIVANGIQAWVDLSSNCPQVQLDNGSEQQQRQAQTLLDGLDEHVYEFGFDHGAGLQKLLELFFLEYYTFGRFCAEIIPYNDLSGVAYVGLINPFSVKMRRVNGQVVLEQVTIGKDGQQHRRRLPEAWTFYAAFDPDGKHPQGQSILDAIGWVIEIKEKMLEDMARSSHNTGHPRLHIAVKPPEMFAGEQAQAYQSRADKEFTDAIDAFRDLDVDDNPVTWDNVTLTVVGGNRTGEFSWSTNFQQVNDEVVSGLRLYPWVLGLSSGTTKNWVDSQHDLLMQRIGRGTLAGTRFLDFIRNTELRLRGSPVRARQHFEPIRDPGKLIQERAKKFEFDRVDNMVQRQYISKDEGARLLGLPRAFEQDK